MEFVRKSKFIQAHLVSNVNERLNMNALSQSSVYAIEILSFSSIRVILFLQLVVFGNNNEDPKIWINF